MIRDFPRSLGIRLAAGGLGSRRGSARPCRGWISKDGDRLLRTPLHECAHGLMYEARRSHPSKAWALGLTRRLGRGPAISLERKSL